jgi:hypothetical protein
VSIKRLRARMQDQRGVVAVVVALLMVVLGGSAAMTFDLSRLRHERHLIQAAVDLGSLAGAAYMPVTTPAEAAAAEAVAREVATANASGLAPGDISIEFLCVVSDPEGDGGGNSDELRYRCGHPNVDWGDALWTSRGGKAAHACNPYGGDICNAIRLTASSEIDFYFAPLIGFNEGNTGAVQAASCRGCGPVPIDMVIIVDRSLSMSSSDVANVRRAIANTDGPLNSILEFYNPGNVRVGLIALPYKEPSNPNVMDNRQDYNGVPDSTPTQAALWRVQPLSNNYRLGSGNLNPASPLVQSVVNLSQGSTTVYVDGLISDCQANCVFRYGSGHTNYGDPLSAAQWMLENDPLERPDVPDVIVFMGDGEANQPQLFQNLPGPPNGREPVAGSYNPCDYANDAATLAKATPPPGQDQTTIFSLAYGAGGGPTSDARCLSDWTPSSFAGGVYATTFFAAVASPLADGTPSGDSLPGGCAVDENTDGDYYFCEERGDNLSTVFLQIANATQQHSQLVNF